MAAAMLPALLVGCSAPSLAYNQAATLGYWWLDGYVDVTPAQAPTIRDTLAQALAWHRRSQLPDVIVKLDQLKSDALRDTTPERTCAWWYTAQSHLDAVLDQLAPRVSELGATLGQAQFKTLEKKFRERDDTWRKDHMKPDLAERERLQLERVIERAEKIYGRLSAEQSAWLSEQLRRSPWDPARWLADRQSHQRQILDGLKQLASPGPSAAASADSVAATRAWMLRAAHPEGPDLQALVTHQCSLMAGLHNRTTAPQRQHAADEVASWARDARALVAQAR